MHEIRYLIARMFSIQGKKRAQAGAILMPGGWLCIGLLFCPTDNGGSGLALAFNILTWIVLALTVGWLSLTMPFNMKINWLPRILVVGAGLWTLPIIWSSSSEDRLSSLPHILALWGFLFSLLWLRSLHIKNCRSGWLIAIWGGALLQGGFGLFQIVSGKVGLRPMGVFYQPNLLASMLATGLACLIYQRWFEKGKQRKNLFNLFQCLGLGFLSFMLVLCQSRAGWVGALLSSTILIVLKVKQERSRELLADLCLITAGVLLALIWQHGLVIINKQGSNHERWLIIRTTCHLIHQHPWRGWGYGSFERVFGNQLVADNATHGVVLIHPHNEILYAWVEGGVFALSGIILMVISVLRELWKRGGLGCRGMALLLPLATHINLEYPLYQSVPHGLLLLILLAMTLAPCTANSIIEEKRGTAIGLRLATLISSVALLFFMTGTLQTQRRMIAVERESMMPLALDENRVMAGLWNRYGLYERLDYDRHVAFLMRYNLTHEPQLLNQFDSWAETWLLRHADVNVAVSRLMIARATETSRYLLLCEKLHKRYPDESRISCSE